MSATIRIVADLKGILLISEFKLLFDKAAKVFDFDPLLFHGVAVSDGYAVVGGVVSSPTVSKSTVMQKGVPISSCRR